MKQIENKITEISQNENALRYADLLKIIVNFPEEKGFSAADLRMRIKIVDILETEKEADVLNLEDAQFEYVKSLVKVFRWAMLHKDIVSFIDYIESV